MYLPDVEIWITPIAGAVECASWSYPHSNISHDNNRAIDGLLLYEIEVVVNEFFRMNPQPLC